MKRLQMFLICFVLLLACVSVTGLSYMVGYHQAKAESNVWISELAKLHMDREAAWRSAMFLIERELSVRGGGTIGVVDLDHSGNFTGRVAIGVFKNENTNNPFTRFVVQDRIVSVQRYADLGRQFLVEETVPLKVR